MVEHAHSMSGTKGAKKNKGMYGCRHVAHVVGGSGHGQGATPFVYLIFESTCLMGCDIEFRGLIFLEFWIDTKAVASSS